MANPLGAAGQIIATTFDNYSATAADNVSKNNALLAKLRKNNSLKPFDGGREIFQNLMYAENTTYTRYTGYENINTAPSDIITGAKFAIKQSAISVTISGLETLQNSGKSAIINLAKEKAKNATMTMENRMAEDVYSDGTADNGRQIGGLGLLVSKTPNTGIVGGIDASIHEFWRNKALAYDAADVLNANPTATNINIPMNRLFNQLVRGADKPDLIVADSEAFELYQGYVQDKARVTSKDFDDLGFMNLKFNGADVVLDGGYGGNSPAKTMYFLNTKYIHFRPHKDRNFKRIGGEKRESTNQDASVTLMGFAGNMTLSCRFLQGVGYWT